MTTLRNLALVALLAVSTSALGDDLGVVGPIYDITERDAIELITSTLKRMEKSGELKRFEADAKKQVVESIEHPRPLTGFKSTASPATHYYDPSMITQKDIADGTGKMLYPRGTHVNPLDYVGWNSYLLFLDGRDEKQLAYGKRIATTSDRPVKIVLVAGEPMALMRKWKSPVYFDQGGRLLRRFSIEQVPAIVRQEGKRLRVDELLY